MHVDASQRHHVERFKHERRRRSLSVERVIRLTPKMLRVEFKSPDLSDFVSLSPDDHIKLILPDASTPEGVCMRDFTPRAFDNEKQTLTIDFALHEQGPATAWATDAKPGDILEIGGPRGSAVVADDFDYYLLVGDETALPSIGRRVAALRRGVSVTTVLVVDGPEEVQHFETEAEWRSRWVFRCEENVDDASLLRNALELWRKPDGDGYVWIAAEAFVARALRDYMLEARSHPKSWLKAAGYWVRGKAGAEDKLMK